MKKISNDCGRSKEILENSDMKSIWTRVQSSKDDFNDKYFTFPFSVIEDHEV